MAWPGSVHHHNIMLGAYRCTPRMARPGSVQHHAVVLCACLWRPQHASGRQRMHVTLPYALRSGQQPLMCLTAHGIASAGVCCANLRLPLSQHVSGHPCVLRFHALYITCTCLLSTGKLLCLATGFLMWDAILSTITLPLHHPHLPILPPHNTMKSSFEPVARPIFQHSHQRPVLILFPPCN